jgi:hypothetical protein
MSVNVEISTARYEWAHHRKPRGYGLWYFRMPDGRTLCVHDTYGRAERLAAARARSLVSDPPVCVLLCA